MDAFGYRHTNGTTTGVGETCGCLDCLCALNDRTPMVPESRFMNLKKIDVDADLYVPLPDDGLLLKYVPKNELGKGLPFVTRCQWCPWEDRWMDFGEGYRAASAMRADRHTERAHQKGYTMTRTTAEVGRA